MLTKFSRVVSFVRAHEAETQASLNQTLTLLAAIMALSVMLSVVILSQVRDGSVLSCSADTCFTYPT